MSGPTGGCQGRRDRRVDRRAGRRRRARRLGRGRRQDRAARGRPVPPVRQDARRRPARQPGLRARQPRQAQRRARSVDRGRQARRARPARRQADVFVTNVRRSALERLGLDDVTLLARNPRLVYGHITGLRARGRRCRQGGLRHRRVLVARRDRPPADRAGRRPAVPARRDGRSQHRLDVRRRHLRRAVRPRAHRRGSAGLDVAAPPGRLHRQLRPEHRARLGPAPGDRHARDDGEPVDQQLPAGMRPALLDRRPRE